MSSQHPFRALVASGNGGLALLLAMDGDEAATSYIADLNDDVGWGEDLAQDEDASPLPVGLYVWEGVMEFFCYSAGDYGGPPYESDACPVGKARPATEADLRAFGVLP